LRPTTTGPRRVAGGQAATVILFRQLRLADSNSLTVEEIAPHR
jgi:hypothetical protein